MSVKEFIKARLDQDEAWANAMQHETADSQLYACPATRSAPLGDLEWGEDACDCGLAERKGRALREVAAKRRMLAEVVEQIDEMDSRIEGEWGSGYRTTGESDLLLALLALPYSDHPDYRAEWAPDADRA